jgi:hypothetical protein
VQALLGAGATDFRLHVPHGLGPEPGLAGLVAGFRTLVGREPVDGPGGQE